MDGAELLRKMRTLFKISFSLHYKTLAFIKRIGRYNIWVEVILVSIYGAVRKFYFIALYNRLCEFLAKFKKHFSTMNT